MTGSGSRSLKIVGILAALAAILYGLSLIGDLVELVLIAALLAYVLDPLALFLESRGLTRTMATGVIFVVFLGLMGAGMAYIVPSMVKEMRSIELGSTAERANELLAKTEDALEQRLGVIGVKDMNLREKVNGLLENAGQTVYGYLGKVGSLFSSMLIVPFVLFFLLKDWRGLKKQFISMVPNRYFEFSLSLMHKSDEQLGGYLRGTFMDSLIIGILSFAALVYLDVPYALLLGIFAGLSNMIPFIGPIFGAVPAVLVAFFDSGEPMKMGAVAIAFVIVQVLDNVAVKPLVVARMVSLHPIFVLLVVIVGGQFFGIMGMFLSVPVASIIKVVAEEAVRNYRMYQRAGQFMKKRFPYPNRSSV